MDSFLQNLYGLAGRVSVVIGGTGVLGSAMARGLLYAGADVVIVGRNASAGERHVEAWKSLETDGTAAFVQADATHRNELAGVLEFVEGRFGRLDVLINAAGVNDATPFLEISEESWDRIFAVNLKSVFLACQVFGRYFIDRNRGGSIINIGSMAGLKPISRVFAYSASKAALTNLTQNLAREWAPHRIRVNTLAPGFFPAEQNRLILTEDRVKSIMDHTPMARFGNPEELVAAVVWLASEKASSFVTGAVIPVDGGFSAASI